MFEPPVDASVEWLALDRAYADYLDAHPEPPGGSLLAQTILSAATRREVLSLFGVVDDMELLDLGTGFGPLALEAAHVRRVRVTGIDTDDAVLAVARTVRDSLGEWIHPGSTVQFERGDATALHQADASIDGVMVRLLFQHLEHPERSASEIARVLRPGGRVLVFDVDDGMSLTFPPPSPTLQALEAAFSECQHRRGGDREIGRKLSTLLSDAGLVIRLVHPIAQAAHHASEVGDAARQLNSARFRAARSDIVTSGLLSPEDFDELLDAYENEEQAPRFRSETQLAVVAEKPTS